MEKYFKQDLAYETFGRIYNQLSKFCKLDARNYDSNNYHFLKVYNIITECNQLTDSINSIYIQQTNVDYLTDLM